MSQSGNGVEPVPEKVLKLVSRVRFRMRDYAILNRLTDGEEHSDRSIAAALIAAVEYWNETPPLTSTHSVVSFPHTELLTSGAIPYLLESLMLLSERNNIRYTDGQVSVSLSDRNQLLNLRAMLKQEFTSKVNSLKLAENLKGSMGGRGVPSEYAHANNNSWYDYFE